MPKLTTIRELMWPGGALDMQFDAQGRIREILAFVPNGYTGHVVMTSTKSQTTFDELYVAPVADHPEITPTEGGTATVVDGVTGMQWQRSVRPPMDTDDYSMSSGISRTRT